ncbi:MAG TPA: serine/threonine-protein kinase, partial [Urbifossiella sp.]|nr:serine/threonine-protein kinase [Urbifossiella sp.]
LKFLPPHLAADPDRLARFRREVAAARKVSHPHVCRVYDIADDGGQPFLSMEFVDGEDLSSVLKRLGRVPEEKGLDIARELCAALAAVHDQGLLHRDLKPANVMLDGRGRVRLTDFGLAAGADDLSATEVRSGTPLYQAPEQLAGREVTVRSDIYALGLVLYEVFTGRRAFPDARRDTPPSKPTSHVTNLNPAVEAVILRCLAPDPANRPRSAAEVLAGLPGGDPLAAALAAGRTPSPQLVADADPGDGPMRPWVALAFVAVVAAGVLVTGWLGGLALLAPRAGMREAEPAVMRHKAREVLAALGHDEPPAGAGYRYLGNHDFLDHRRAHDPAPGVWDGRWRGLEDGRPPAMLFIYRVARDPLAPTNYHVYRETPGVIDALNPPPLDPGMADVTLDLRGRLLRYHKVSDFLGPESPAPADWRLAFAAAGLDFAAFTANPVPPRHRPPLAADARVAWEGPYPDPAADRVRVEAASLGGRPVYFAVEFPWDAGEKAAAYPVNRPPMNPGTAVLLYGLPLAAVGLAVWHWRAGRTDLAGAARLAGVLFALWFVRWAVTAVHVTDSREELLLEIGLGAAMYQAVLAAAFYLALEPVVRKRWPWRLVGWSRLLAGRVRDPLVGRDVLVGLAAGTVLTLGFFHRLCGPVWAPELLDPPALGEVEFDPAWCVTRPLTTGVGAGFLYFFLTFLCHWVCRDQR